MTETSPADTPKPSEHEAPPREPIFNLPPVVVVLIALCVGVHLLRLYVLTIDQDLWLLPRAAFIPVLYSGQFPLDAYSFTSPVTYSLLHGNLAHLTVNMIWLAAFGSPLANRLGVGRFLLFWVAASVGAVALHWSLHAMDQSPLIGASGAISGMMGAAARFGFRIDRRQGRPAFGGGVLPIPVVMRSRGVVTFLVIWMIVNLVTGLVGIGESGGSQIAWEAHIGGFLVGFLGIGAFVGRPARPGAA